MCGVSSPKIKVTVYTLVRYAPEGNYDNSQIMTLVKTVSNFQITNVGR